MKLEDTVHIIKTGKTHRIKQITKTIIFNPPSTTFKYLLDDGNEYDETLLKFDKQLSRDNKLKDIFAKKEKN